MAKDTVTVRLINEQRAVAWSGGVFAGDEELVQEARRLAAVGANVEVAIPGGFLTAGSQSRKAAMAAMLGAARGQGVVLQRDPELWDWLDVPSDGGDIVY